MSKEEFFINEKFMYIDKVFNKFWSACIGAFVSVGTSLVDAF